LSRRKDENDYCWIDWKKAGSWGENVSEGEPCGVNPGGTAMKVRRCDMLLEGVANKLFVEDPEPDFHIYWPLARRDEARAARRQWLEQVSARRD